MKPSFQQAFNKALQQEELTQALFKQRYQIPENENKFNSCTEELHEIDEEENNEFSN